MKGASWLQRSFWRFSLRELILLVLAIAAFLGWGLAIFRWRLPVTPTPFARSLLLEVDVAAVRQQIGDTLVSSSRTTGDGGNSTGKRYQFDYRLFFPLTTANARPFMKALYERLSSQVEARGCELGSHGYLGDSFRLNYERGSIDGTLRAILIAEGDQAQLLVFVEEQRKPP